MPRQTTVQGEAVPARGNSLARRVGERVRELRAEEGWSQRELAAHLGISASRLNKYESGVHVPPLRTLLRLARIFAVELDALVPPEAAERSGGPDLSQLAAEAQRLPRRERQALGVIAEALLRSLDQTPAGNADRGGEGVARG